MQHHYTCETYLASHAVNYVVTIQTAPCLDNKRGLGKMTGAYLQNLLCCFNTLKLEVGHPNGLGQPLLLAICQTLHKGIIAPAVCDEAWPVNHVQAKLADAKPLKTLPASKVNLQGTDYLIISSLSSFLRRFVRMVL